MDLLRQILARLPLQRIFDLHLSDQQLLNLRTRVVNHISEDYLSNLTGEIFTNYLMLCTLQGELCSEATRFLPVEMICARAAFVRDRVTSRLMRSHPKASLNLNIDLALASGDLEIITSTVETARSPYNVIDPEIVNWRPEIVALYQKLISDSSGTIIIPRVTQLMGYLHIPMRGVSHDLDKNLSGLTIGYKRGYVLAEMRDRLDPFADDSTLYQFLGRIHLEIPIYGGYFGFNFSERIDEIRRLAFRCVQPKLVRRLPVGTPPNPIPMLTVTQRVARNAREMIPVLNEFYPNAIAYRMQMQVIAGEVLDLDLLKSLSYNDALLITETMVEIAHPQLTTRTLENVYYSHSNTSVHYDLVNYFRQILSFGRFVTGDQVLFLCAYGQLLQCFRADQMKELAGTLKKLNSSR